MRSASRFCEAVDLRLRTGRSPRAAEAVGRVCRVVTRCRFERTDIAGDEVVLVRILQVPPHRP